MIAGKLVGHTQRRCPIDTDPTTQTQTLDAAMKILAVALYAGVLLVIGYLASRRMNSIRDYFASGKNLGFFHVAFSARATGESAWLLIGLTGMGYALGAQAFWVVLGEMLGVGGAWLIMSRRFKRLSDRYDSITVPDYLESRFRDSGHWLRLIAAGSLVIFVPIYAGAQVFATGDAFNSFLGWDHILGATVGFAVVLLYITQGGFTAVVWSDVFQGSLMFLGLVGLPVVILLEAGGYTGIVDSLRAIDPDLLSLHGPGPKDADGVIAPGSGGWTPTTLVAIVGLAAIGIGFWGSPQVFVRFISMKNEQQIAPGAATALIWTLLADSGAVLIGLFGRALFSPEALGGDHEAILPHASVELLPAFFAGIFIAMVLSAIMSTIDSLLVVASSAGVRDYWQKTRHPDMSDEKLVSLSRVVTLVLSLFAFAIGIALLLLNREKPLFWIVIFGWSGIAATFCPTIILSLFWSRITALGAKCSMVAGFMGVPLFSFAVPPLLRSFDPPAPTPEEIAAGADPVVSTFFSDLAGHLVTLDVLLPSFLIGFAVAIVVSLLDKKGQAQLEGVAEDLRFAKTGQE